ncbi:CopG family transcriptional regulator [archaeon]|nr:MAG: CopG family transcriptional regulator [archaeon]RLG65465.1 MAG: CopG family transcriptional regulator [archaeon]HDM23720.1 ribbon-helix-helix protein, CopG family [Candidatus Bathyarchaeota archaeon]
MVVITVRFPEVFVEGLDELVRRRIYSSRSEAIRDAVRRLLKSELGRLG